MELVKHPLYLDIVRTGEFNINRKQVGTDFFIITVSTVSNYARLNDPLVSVTTSADDEIAAFEEAINILRNGMPILRDFPSPPMFAPEREVTKKLSKLVRGPRHAD